MPVIDIKSAQLRQGISVYPSPFREIMLGRNKRALGTLVGLTQFGVNLTELEPGAMSALRHWHENEDEFIYVLEGELVLVDDDGEHLLKEGDAAGFRAGDPNGHHLQNRSDKAATYLEIGTRAATERGHYPDDDLAYVKTSDGFTFMHKSGEPYDEEI